MFVCSGERFMEANDQTSSEKNMDFSSKTSVIRRMEVNCVLVIENCRSIICDKQCINFFSNGANNYILFKHLTQVLFEVFQVVR